MSRSDPYSAPRYDSRERLKNAVSGFDDKMRRQIRYSILDPNGNITALVESRVSPDEQPSLAAEIMRLHPEVEQVGFVRFRDGNSVPDGVHAELRMAGGEFCGNASLCAAALYLLRQENDVNLPVESSRWQDRRSSPGKNTDPQNCFTRRDGGQDGAEVRLKRFSSSELSDSDYHTVYLRVSGASSIVKTKLKKDSRCSFSGTVSMPPALEISDHLFVYENVREALPLVRMEGISHIIIAASSASYALLHNPEAAENAVRKWCAELHADGLGLMFLSVLPAGDYGLTPLVFIPGSGTVFWENSCASGSAAAAMYLASASGKKALLTFREPGGVLRAESDPGSGETLLYGKVSQWGQSHLTHL